MRVMQKTFFIETFGCQMNKNDSELMALSLIEHGFVQSARIEDADIAVFNTCSVREHAESRALSRIRSHGKSVRDRKGLLIVAGCMAQRLGRELMDNDIADMVVGPYQTPDIGKSIKAYLDDHRNKEFLSQSPLDFSKRINPLLRHIDDTPVWHRWVTITHGCDNFCSYCIVPNVRGRLISLPSGQILEYIRGLAGSGIREITLLGQNVNQYGTDSGDIPFARLLERAAQIPGIERLNFITSHPKDFTDETLFVIRDNPNIARSVHLPLQSGSDRILGLMNRNYTLSRYHAIVDGIARHLGACSLSTDLIVGFPGETEDDFDETIRAVEEIRFDDAFTYAYSKRSGTPAGSLVELIPRQEKMDRLRRLIALQRSISGWKLEERIDSIQETIIERFSKKSSARVMGRTYMNNIVVVPGTGEDIGKKLRIRINAVKGATLQGTRIA